MIIKMPKPQIIKYKKNRIEVYRLNFYAPGCNGLFVTVWRVFTYYLNLLVGGILMSFGFARKKSVTQDHHQTTDKVSHDV